MRVFMPAAMVLLTTAIWSVPAFAVQDTPTTINGVETVCTGVGSAKDDPRWPAYPVKIVISNSTGQNLAAMQLALTRNGKPVVQTVCDAPWILFKLPAGHYSATATVAGGAGLSRKADFTTNGSGPQQEVGVSFPAMPPNQ